MIYTSYFANQKKLPNDLYPFSIARFKPKWFTGTTILELIPSLILLRWWRASDKSDEAKEKYIKMYNLQLTEKDPHRLATLLQQKCGDKIPVLLCFEKPDEFCHRHLVAEWFNKNEIECKEYK